jgi:hypothetical protein
MEAKPSRGSTVARRGRGPDRQGVYGWGQTPAEIDDVTIVDRFAHKATLPHYVRHSRHDAGHAGP